MPAGTGLMQSAAGGMSPSELARLEYLEANEYKVTYWASIATNSGTITKPTGSTIILDSFASGVDALVETISNGQPTGYSPVTGGGAYVTVSSFDASGNYTLSGTPSATPVALLYILTIPADQYQNLDLTKVITSEPHVYLALDGSNANTDVDIGNYSMNAKSFHVKGTAGAGHVGLKHQSADITANASESSIGADSDGVAVWKNNGNVLQKFYLFKRTAVGDANYTILKSDEFVVTNAAFTAPRTWTLPADAIDSTEIVVADNLQTITSTNTLTVGVATGKYLNGVLNGTLTVSTAGAWRRFKTDGSGNWFYDAGIARLGVSQTFTGINTFSQAIVASSETASTIASFDASKNIKSLATSTYPSLTELSYVKGVTSAIQTQLDGKGYTVSSRFYAALSPTDGTTYYPVYVFASNVTSGGARSRHKVLKSGTKVNVGWTHSCSAGSNEGVTLYVTNVTTSTTITITSTIDMSASTANNSYLNNLLVYTAGDLIEVSFLCPSWATNPTALVFNVDLQFI